MSIDRRTFLAGASAMVGFAGAARAGRSDRIKAIAFDGFPIIDPRPLGMRAEQLFPGKGELLMNAWRTRQFEYTWLRTLGGQYMDFWSVTNDALRFAAQSLGLSMSDPARDSLMSVYLQLGAWPDVRPALERLRAAGIRSAFLANLTAPMLDAALKNSGLQHFFEPHLSTDRVRAFKPDPRAYRMGPDAFGFSLREIAFCASAGWDAAGAKWFGYPTFWVNRNGQAVEQLHAQPDGMGTGMNDLVDFVLGS
jgi:2-haloacid dehalogenase